MLNATTRALNIQSASISCSAATCATPGELAERAARTHCALLITGETGTGKGHFARWIHEHGPRADAPFVPVNCGAIPQDLIDSHLFGHVRGAFSGASGNHLGIVRAATGGTLLLDEVGELPPSAQVRLLRLLEEREVQPVGQSGPVIVDVRIIAATSADLSEAVRRGTFRKDLYFRLDVVRLELGPLRERRAEIEPLVHTFNDEFARVYRQPELRFTDAALAALQQHRWPGNVRELRTLVERLHVLGGPFERPVSVDDLRQFGRLDAPRGSGAGGEHPMGTIMSGRAAIRLYEMKLDVVSRAIDESHGNMSRAASALGVHRSTLYRWLADRRATA